MPESTSWPLTVKVGSGFLIRSAIIAVMCLVLGLWGIYDYLVAIPTQELRYHRAEVARQFNRIAEPLLNDSKEPVDDALEGFRNAVIADLRIEPAPELANEVNGLQMIANDDGGGSLSLNELGRLLATYLKTTDAVDTPAEKVTANWLSTVGGMTVIAQTPVALGGEPVPELKTLREAANKSLLVWGDVQPPSKYDRPMQWLFILCLPFVPWYAWSAFAAGKRRYVLDEDGTLHLPEGTWPRDDIAEIDMRSWMRKSKAKVVHVDGRTALLDDYVFKGLHRIVGVLAHAQDPDLWTQDAKRVKPPAAAEPGVDKVRAEADTDTDTMETDPDPIHDKAE